MTDQRKLFEAAVVERLKESGFLEVEIRVECLARCDEGYQDEVINAGWHYWNEAISAQPAPETKMDGRSANGVSRPSEDADAKSDCDGASITDGPLDHHISADVNKRGGTQSGKPSRQTNTRERLIMRLHRTQIFSKAAHNSPFTAFNSRLFNPPRITILRRKNLCFDPLKIAPVLKKTFVYQAIILAVRQGDILKLLREEVRSFIVIHRPHRVELLNRHSMHASIVPRGMEMGSIYTSCKCATSEGQP